GLTVPHMTMATVLAMRSALITGCDSRPWVLQFIVNLASKRRSREFQRQLVHFLRAAVAHKHPGTIAHAATPETKRTGVAFNALELKHALCMVFTDFDSADGLFVANQVIKVNIFAVSRPYGITHSSCRR